MKPRFMRKNTLSYRYGLGLSDPNPPAMASPPSKGIPHETRPWYPPLQPLQTSL